MPYGAVNWAGPSPVGGNPGNSMALLGQRLFGMGSGGGTQYGSPEAERGMAEFLGLKGAGQSMPGNTGVVGPPMQRAAAPGMAPGQQWLDRIQARPDNPARDAAMARYNQWMQTKPPVGGIGGNMPVTSHQSQVTGGMSRPAMMPPQQGGGAMSAREGGMANQMMPPQQFGGGGLGGPNPPQQQRPLGGGWNGGGGMGAMPMPGAGPMTNMAMPPSFDAQINGLGSWQPQGMGLGGGLPPGLAPGGFAGGGMGGGPAMGAPQQAQVTIPEPAPAPAPPAPPRAGMPGGPPGMSNQPYPDQFSDPNIRSPRPPPMVRMPPGPVSNSEGAANDYFSRRLAYLKSQEGSR